MKLAAAGLYIVWSLHSVFGPATIYGHTIAECAVAETESILCPAVPRYLDLSPAALGLRPWASKAQISVPSPAGHKENFELLKWQNFGSASMSL
jgi:hypothetical protein